MLFIGAAWQTEGMEIMMEHGCDCHEHGHGHGHTAEEMAALQEKQRQLVILKPHMVKIQALHDKIDAVLSKVEKDNIGLLLTQKKNLKALQREYREINTGQLAQMLPPAVMQVEREYIDNIEDILHHARLFKRGLQGNVTAEVVKNLEQSL